MAMVSAMLSMQSRRSDNEYVHTTFKEIRNKIRTMSLVHQKLYQSKDLSSINLKDYIKDLVNLLMASYGIKKEKVALTFELKDVFVLIDVAIPLGLVLNELISNIFKHAFPHSKNDEISLKLFRDKDNDIHVLLSDNGKGVPQGLDLEKSQSMGLQTVFALIKDQMNGTVSYQTKNGLHWNFSIKDDMYKERI
jgi:two-component sensor histidine kinase